MEFERKEDTRSKIKLGGLIIKAGLSDELMTVLYGLLLEGKEALSREGKPLRDHWKLRGEVGFKEI